MARQQCTGLQGQWCFGFEWMSIALAHFCRMLTGGEDPLYIARRLVVVASEDVGLADPHGLPLVSNSADSWFS